MTPRNPLPACLSHLAQHSPLPGPSVAAPPHAATTIRGLESEARENAARIEAQHREIVRLRALVTRLTDVADDLSKQTSDPGTEALAAIHCGRYFIYG